MKVRLLVSVLAALLALTLAPLHAEKSSKPGDAAPTAKPAAEAPTAKPKRDWYPFRGTVAAVDNKAARLTLKKLEGERVIQMDGASAFTRDGKTIPLSDVKTGEYVHGKLHKNSSNQEVLVSAKVEKEAPQEPSKDAGKAAGKHPAGHPAKPESGQK